MNDHVWEVAALRGRSAAQARPREPGRYAGTRWQPAGVPKSLRVTLQAAAIAAAFLLLTGFYNVVRGAVARGPALLAPAPVTAPAVDVANAAAPGVWDCTAARRGVCTHLSAQAAPSQGMARQVSFESR